MLATGTRLGPYITRATQPMLIFNGELDFFFPAEDKKWLKYPLAHSVPRTELTQETLRWLDRYLGPVAPSS